MMFDDSLETQIIKSERLLKEVQCQNEMMTREMNALLNHLDITPEQLSEFLSTESNFTQEEWTLLAELQQQDADKLNNLLDNIPNPAERQIKYEERNIANHWVLVR